MYYSTGTPTCPFGYGLSYSDFTSSDARADAAVDANGVGRGTFTVTTTGAVPGATVA